MKNYLTKYAKKLRQDSTDAENKLWYFLKAKQLNGLKFRRQQPIGKYIVDFVCFSKKIVIELDGGQHDEIQNLEKDQLRDQWLNSQGYKVLRFWNHDVQENIEGVYDEIEKEV